MTGSSVPIFPLQFFARREPRMQGASYNTRRGDANVEYCILRMFC